MPAGYAVDKYQLDQLMGQVTRQIDTWAPDALKIKGWLDTMTEEDLTSTPFGYTPEDVAVMKSAFNDLALLARIYQGNDIIEEARDLGVFSRRLAGLFL